MTRRLVSLIRHAPGAPRGSEPSLEANSYAVTQDLDLTVVLLRDAVRLAVGAGETPARYIAGAAFPSASPAHDLQALLESGIDVLAHDEAIAGLGIDPSELLPGVQVADNDGIAATVDAADGVLTW
ncbi:DsrE family protein [Euzebya tangerina]|uniref:DsrE family protein n=1 Tax=Euzebya tangerina TaxID=591198 RepID=UPI000E31FA3A|nr:DsrE family protein [Euzebya tangerina]